MKNLKNILKIALAVVIPLISIMGSFSYAAHDNSGVYFNLYNGAARPTGTYRVLTDSTTNNVKNVIKIVETNSSGTQVSQETKNGAVYCLKNGVGFGNFTGTTRNPVQYTEYFYLNNPNDSLFTDSANETYRNVLPTGENFNKLIWLLNNICLPEDETSKNNLLTAAANYVGKSGKLDFSVYQVPNKSTADVEKDIIEVVQQAAIWYFTNPSGEFHPKFSTSAGGNFYLDGRDLEGYAKAADGSSLGFLPEDIPHLALYKYLIETAEKQGTYTSPEVQSPITFDKNSAVVTTNSNEFLIGPYKLSGNATGINLTAAITDENFIPQSVKLVGEDKVTELTGSSIADKIKSNINKNFYISLPLSTTAKKVTIHVGANYSAKTLKYWSVPANKVATEQPVVVIKNENLSYAENDEKEIVKPEFDLALRKFITQIKDKNGQNQTFESREPKFTQEDLRALATGTSELDGGNTLKKPHTKEPLPIETGSTVVYTIRVYNEGQIPGEATQITDYLPEGLELTKNSDINTQYGWKEDEANKKIVRTSVLSTKTIDAFNKAPTNGVYEIDSEDVQIECTVVATPESTDKHLKNVAEITAYTNVANVTERDSTPNNVSHDDNNSNYKGTQNEIGKGEEDDDDYEDLVLLGRYFDLSLRKFITAVNDKTYDRAPVVDVGPLKDRTDTTAIYKHRKDPISVAPGDIITYTLRVYNEGQVDGYAQKIVDHLPEYLEFISDITSTDPVIKEATEFNARYGWLVDKEDKTERTIYTTILSKENDIENIIKAFDSSKNTLEPPQEIQIKCRVKSDAPSLKELTNIAEIAESYNDAGLADRDNLKTVVLPSDDVLPNYRGHENNKDLELSNKESFFKGQEDDDDFEKVVLRKFDLALKKFIIGVNDTELKAEDGKYDREPTINTENYGKVVDGTEITDFEYSFKQNPPKDPVRVTQNDVVIYKIRAYNEGTQNGYASVIKDDIPVGLEYLPEHATNVKYKWDMYDENGNRTEDPKTAKTIITSYLSQENGKAGKGPSGYDKSNSNLLLAYDAETMGNNPDYVEVEVAFKVVQPNTADRIVINHAQISDDKDENNEDVTDIDSTPDKWEDDDDDQDIEKIYVKYFDLALRKWVTHAIVIEDGVQKEMATDHYAEQEPESAVKVEVNEKRLKETVIKFRYSIRVTNEGEIDGYATEISDYVPSGLKFNQADNPNWKEENGKIITEELKDKLLKPGESATVELVLTWVNDENNMGVMTNWAEISKDKNDSNTPDIDSTPNNKKEDEDDMDYAPVVLAVIAGIAQKYIVMISTAFIIVAGGVFLIKKYVL